MTRWWSFQNCSILGPLKAVSVAVGKALLAYLAVVGGAARGVRGHGYLEVPAARNVQHNSDWCPQCLNAGGPSVVFARGRPGRYGVCGDAWNKPRDHEAGGRFATPPKIAGRYEAGQVFTAKVRLTANHKGRWSLRLCPKPAGESQSCFDKYLLRRADGRGPFTPVPGDTSDFVVKYKLPKGVTCKRCVMQWTYETGNSCNPPGIPNPQQGLESCRTSTNGEMFWNCADVEIVRPS